MPNGLLALLSAFNGYGQGRLDKQRTDYAHEQDTLTRQTQTQGREGQWIGNLLTRLSSGDLTPEGYANGIKYGAQLFGYDESKYQLPSSQLPAGSPPSPGSSSLAPVPVPTGAFGLPSSLGGSAASGGNMYGGGFGGLGGQPPGGPLTAPGAPMGGGVNPFLSPNARLKQTKTQGGIDFQNWKMQQPPAGVAGAGEQFSKSLPGALSQIGLLPHPLQPGAVNALIGEGKRLGVDVSSILMPGAQNGTRPLNYGRSPGDLATIGAARQVLSQSSDPNAAVNIGGKKYTRQQFAQAFPEGTAPAYNPFFGPNAKDAATIAGTQSRTDNTNTRTDLMGRNFSLSQDKFTSEKAYRAALIKLRAQALQYQHQGLTDREIEDKVHDDFTRGRITLEGMKFQHSLTTGGGTGSKGDPMETQYQKNLKRMTQLAPRQLKSPITGLPVTDPRTGAPVYAPLSPQAQEEYDHLTHQNRAIRVQQQQRGSGAAPGGSRLPFSPFGNLGNGTGTTLPGFGITRAGLGLLPPVGPDGQRHAPNGPAPRGASGSGTGGTRPPLTLRSRTGRVWKVNIGR